MNHFDFIFQGQLHEGVTRESAQSGLAKAFGCELSEVEPLFKGQAIFKREGIDSLTAHAYQRQFDELGCQSELVSVDDSVCDQSPVSLDEALVKFEDLEEEHQETSPISSRFLTLSCLAILVLATIDPFLQGFVTEHQAGIDLGYWPMVGAHILLIFGCLFYAKEKKLPLYFGLLGFFSIAGMATLLAIQKYKHKTGSIAKEVLLALFVFGVLIYWMSGWINSSVYARQFIAQSPALFDKKHEYPSTHVQPLADFDVEHKQMLGYLEKVLVYLHQDGHRPDHIEWIAQIMFENLARHQIWKNHQNYLYSIKEVTAEPQWDDKRQETHNKEIMTLLDKYLQPTSPARLQRVHQHWFYGYHPAQGAMITQEITNNIMQLSARISMIPKIDAGRPVLEALPYERFIQMNSSLLSMNVRNNIIELSFTKPPLNHQTLVLGVVWRGRKNKQWFNKKRQSALSWYPKVMMISPDFDTRYLSGAANVFYDLEKTKF